MGSSSSALRSAESSGASQPIVAAGSVVRPPLSIDKSDTSYGGLSPSKSRILNKDVIHHSGENNIMENRKRDCSTDRITDNVASSTTSLDSHETNCSEMNTDPEEQLLPGVENEKSTSEDYEQCKEELKEALEELSLSDHEMQSALQVLKENPRLAESLKICIDCVLSFKSSSQNVCYNNLRTLQGMSQNPGERTDLGTFLGYIKFCQESYALYVRILKAHVYEHYNDALIELAAEDNCEFVNILTEIRNLWWNFSDASAEFGAQIVSQIGIIQELIQNLTNLIGVEGQKLKCSSTFLSAVSILHNTARLTKERHIFRRLKLVNILANFLTYEGQPVVTMLALMVLAYIIDEDQTHLLTSNDSVFDLMIHLPNQAWKSDEHRFEGFGFSVEEMIEAMAGISRNDDVKKVLGKKGILTLLLSILTEGNDKEKEVSLKLLWELSFHPYNRMKIQQDETMMETVQEMSKHANKNIARPAEGVLFVLGVGNMKKSASEEGAGTAEHIMISYNSKDRKKVIEIRDFLKTRGYKIWMDIDNILGSTLQAMTEAVEEAAVVLVCMSETYKESVNCRSEAEYAFQKKKRIIPLYMQSKYEPDGWLGFILGSKPYFDFTGKYPFEKAADELVKEIGNRGKLKDGTSQDSIDGPIIKAVDKPLAKPPEPLHPNTQLNVQDWIQKHNLAELSKLRSLSPEHLLFMKKLSIQAKEFYYSLLLKLLSGKMSSKDLTGLMKATGAVESILQ